MGITDDPIFILEGNGPCTNHGCEAILRGTMLILRSQFGRCKFISTARSEGLPPDETFLEDPDLTHRPAWARRRFTGLWFRNQIDKRIFRRFPYGFEPYLPHCKAVLALGGDNFSLDYGTSVAKRELNVIRIAHEAGKPFAIWGASVGPFSKEQTLEQEAGKLLQEVDLIAARESITVKYLKSIGVESNVKQVADPAFLMEPQHPSHLSNELADALRSNPIGLNISPLIAKRHPQADRFEEVLIEIISSLSEMGNPIVLIPHVNAAGNSDHEYMRQSLHRVQSASVPIVLVGADYNAAELKWIISRCAVFIGSRTHATIASLSTATPTISVGYSIKAEGINVDLLGSTRWLMPIEDLSADGLGERTAALWNEREDVRSLLTQKLPAYKDCAHKAGLYLADAIACFAPRK